MWGGGSPWKLRILNAGFGGWALWGRVSEDMDGLEEQGRGIPVQQQVVRGAEDLCWGQARFCFWSELDPTQMGVSVRDGGG